MVRDTSRPDFLYIQSAPRSGSTYLYDLINSSRSLLLLNEFPIFSYLRNDQIDAALVATATRIAATFGNSFVKDIQNLDIAVNAFLDRAPEREGQAMGGRARRVLGLMRVLSPKYIVRNRWTEQDDSLLLFKMDILLKLTSGVVSLDESDARKLKHFGVKLPGVFRLDDVRHLQKAAGRLRIISVLRNPYNATLSSMQRLIDTRAGVDKWHVASVEEGVKDWIRNYYYSRQCLRIVGSENYLPLIYEDFTGEKNFEAISRFLDVGDVRPIPFEDLESTKVLAADSFGSEIRDCLLRSGLPVGSDWDEFLNTSQNGEPVFNFEPMLPHDFEELDFSDPRCPVIKFGFGAEEPDGAWMVEAEASIRFYLPAKLRHGPIAISLSWPPARKNMLRMRLNGSEEATLDVEGGTLIDGNGRIWPPNRVLLSGELREWNLLEMKVETLHKLGKDTRSLGVKVHKLLLNASEEARYAAPGS